MSHASIVETISIDTQVFVATGYGFTSKSFQSLRNHFASGRLALVMTDITVREVHRRIKQSVDEELLLQREFANKAKALFNCSIPAVKNSVTKFDPNVVAKDLSASFDSFLRKAKAKIIKTSGVTIGDVFDKYFEGIAPFGDSEIKKHEFPDAFCVKALSEWAQKKALKMFVVSGDQKFYEACSKCTQLVPKKTLSEVLDHVASDDSARASFVRRETKKRMSEISAEAKHQFEDRYYWVENMDGDAEVKVETIDPIQDDPEIIEIKKDEASLLMTFDTTYSASLSYDDPATASYDEGDLVYIQHREEDVTDREQELAVEVKVTFDDTDPRSFKITEINLVEPGDSFGIQTEDDYQYDWS